MDRKDINNLSELLEFVQQDFSKVTSSNDRGLLCSELGGLLSSNWLYFVEGTDLWENFLSVCSDLKELIEVIYRAKGYNGMVHYSKSYLFRCPSNSPEDTFTSNLVFNPDRVSMVSISFSLKDRSWLTKEMVGAVLILFSLLEGYPTEWLKSCKECNKIFAQKTARTKMFCSVYCKNKHNLRLKHGR
jgi:hypothetical protein